LRRPSLYSPNQPHPPTLPFSHQVRIHVTDVSATIFDAKDKSQIASTPLTMLSYVSLMGRKGDLVAYVHSDRQTGVNLCHLFRGKTKATQKLPQAINQAFHSAKAKRPSARRAWGDSGGGGGAGGGAAPMSRSPSSAGGAPQAPPSPSPSPSFAAAAQTASPSRASSMNSTAGHDQSVALSRSASAAGQPLGQSSLAASTVSLAPAPEASQIFKARYVGHTTVTQPTGDSVVTEANKMMRRGRARKVLVVLNSQVVQLQDRRTSEILQQSLISELSYTSPRRKRFSFITTDDQHIMFCHTLRFRSKRRCGKLNKALATAFVAASEAAKRPGAFADRSKHARGKACLADNKSWPPPPFSPLLPRLLQMPRPRHKRRPCAGI
jgi:hypothetical protein